MTAGDVLVVEREGIRWGLEQRLVRSFATVGDRVVIALGEQQLLVDRVVTVSRVSKIQPSGRVLARFWPHLNRGLIVMDGRVVVLIDPQAPPPSLAPATEGATDEGREH